MARFSRGALALALVSMIGAFAPMQDDRVSPGGNRSDARTAGADAPPRARDAAPPEPNPAQLRQQFRELTKEQREAIVAVIADLRPMTPEERKRLLSMDIDRFRGLVQQHAAQIMELARIRQAQPDLYRFKIDDFRLARQSEDAARRIAEARRVGRTEAAVALEGELLGLVEQQLDLRYRMRAYEIEALEQRVTDLKSQLEEDRGNRRALIQRRLDELRNRPGQRPGGVRPPPERGGGGGGGEGE